MAKKLCPICKINTFGGLTAMVAKDGEFCGKCWDKFYDIKGRSVQAKDLSLEEIANIIGSNVHVKPSVESGHNENVDETKSSNGLLGGLKDAALKKKQDMAVAKAYKIEQEKRKPRIETIKHVRAFTPQEQMTIDQIDLEIDKIKTQRLADTLSGKQRPLFESELYALTTKRKEIEARCVTYEEIVHPPLVDPNEPIVIDEAAIRASIKSIL